MQQNIAVAVLVDGKLYPADAGHRALEPMQPVDEIVHMLSRVVSLAQTLSERDAGRVREFVRITQAALTASTCLPSNDQQLFQDALRQARR
jgi:hypothetical protein